MLIERVLKVGFASILLNCLLLFSCKSKSDTSMMDPIDPNSAYEFSKDLVVPAEKLYSSFLDPLTLKDIWGVSSITIDPRPEGKAIAKFKIDNQTRDFTLTYKELIPYEKLKWVVHFDSFPEKEIYTTIWFKKIKTGTTVTIRQENFSTPEERDENRKAWDFSIDMLHALTSWEKNKD